jgi:hypothetical protein
MGKKQPRKVMTLRGFFVFMCSQYIWDNTVPVGVSLLAIASVQPLHSSN